MTVQQHAVILFAATYLVLSGPLAAASAAEPIKNSACLECHGDKTLTKTNAAGKEISLFVDLAKLGGSVHKTNLCVSCHADLTDKHPDDNVPAKPSNCKGCHEKQSESYGASVHGLALAKGRKDSATCSDCHDGHTILPPTSPASPLHFSRLAETCGACHDQVAKDVEESVHGKALALGRREAPTCTDCHSEHKIEALKGSSSLKISTDICSGCHSSGRMNTKYKLPTDRVKTFFESYHGLAAQYGSTVSANCGSCHGVHKVLPSTDPRSSIYPTNLVVTCGKCHPGATSNFARSKVHLKKAPGRINFRLNPLAGYNDAAIGEEINNLVRSIYLVLIFGTIGLMLAHNVLLFGKKVRARYRAADLTVVRMSLKSRLAVLDWALSSGGWLVEDDYDGEYQYGAH
ncbi:MAG: hypothetical protein NT154_20790, partial [Verrucomicrobia bacterium]|nr:hypothetical protein [Verrucomicrobiota bacterium]